MRIWTLHPKYLDAKGLVAVWRETLLAQKVLQGETKGYRNHPQLDRFKSQKKPVAAIATYLRHIYEEAKGRGYRFDKEKIASPSNAVRIAATKGQLGYELEHLRKKLRARDIEKYQELKLLKDPEAHPLFRIVDGDVAAWEVRRK